MYQTILGGVSLLPTSSKSGKKSNLLSNATGILSTNEEKVVPSSAIGDYRTQVRKGKEKRGSVFIPNNNYS